MLVFCFSQFILTVAILDAIFSIIQFLFVAVVEHLSNWFLDLFSAHLFRINFSGQIIVCCSLFAVRHSFYVYDLIFGV